MSDAGNSARDESDASPKRGKKVYYPFGTPTHNSVPYSKFAHLHDAHTQEFANKLTSSAEKLEVREPTRDKPRRSPTRKVAPKTNSGGNVSDNASAAETIPDTEGLEPCTKIACQQVIRGITELQYRNEVERDEIEDEYERLLHELAASEQEIAAAEAKLVSLNEIGGQLEMRLGQLHEKVDTLQHTKDAQDTERNDINGKMMILQTEKSKRARALDKAIKALSDATWRKKKKEQQDNVEAGISLPASEISEKPIVHTDASTASSRGGIYRTAYNQLAAERVRDTIELPPPVKTLPPFMMEKLALPEETQGLDKYAQRHYKKVMEHNVKSWEGMEGSLITASIYSASSRGTGPEVVAESYEQYNRIRAYRGMSASVATAASHRVGTILQGRNVVAGVMGGQSVASIIVSASSDQLSHLIRSRENSPAGSKRARASHVSGKYREKPHSGGGITASHGASRSRSLVRLTPLAHNRTDASSPQPSRASRHQDRDQDQDQANLCMGVGEMGFDNYDNSGFGDDGQLSALSPQSLSMSMSLGTQDYNPFGERNSVSTAAPRSLDPVFYKDKARYQFGRQHAVGKLRQADPSWGMKAYMEANKSFADNKEDDDTATNASHKLNGKSATGMGRGRLSVLGGAGGSVEGGGSVSGASLKSGFNSRASSASYSHRDPFVGSPVQPTVKSRSLTVYHPHMRTFQGSVGLPKQAELPTM